MEIDYKRGITTQIRELTQPTEMMLSEYDLCMAMCVIQKPNDTNGKYQWCDKHCDRASFKREKILVNPINHPK